MIFSNGNLSVLNEQQDSTKIDHIKAQKCWSVIYNTLIENFLTLRRDCQEYQTENKKGVYFQNHNIDQREESLMIKLETQNIEQFKFLIWQGAQNSNKNFIGHWIPFWKGENLCAGGYYNNQGIKIGLWNQLFEYYWDNAQITFYGIYHNGIKVQNWKIVYLNHIIGGGQYNQLSEKQGKWVEIDSNFYNLNKVKLIGEYHKGKKVGLWQIMNNSKIVGLGIFGYNGMKKGRWVELSENFWNCSILIQTGRYQNGKKEGIWSNEFKEDSDNDSSVIGGGEYNQNGLKDGNWIELHENFWNCCQVTYNGNYLYGKKIGKWQTIYADNLVGGGTYNYQGIKIEKWIELFETFQDNQQVFYQGQYQLGIKIGKWEILYHENDLGLQKLQEMLQILRGGGDYDNKGRKQGFWVEPYFNFCDQCQIIYVGQYHQSKRIGQWKINFRVNSNEQFLLMQKQNLIFKRGEGFYDQKGRKQGNWVELQENFWNYNQILFLGQYEKGRKIGKWDTSYRNQSDQEFRLIGGGYYNHNTLKEGYWVELFFNFNAVLPVIFAGIYINGIKVGDWNYFYQKKSEIEFYQCGGGSFDQNGIKIGKWNELHNNFGRFYEVKMIGYYLNGIKQGIWQTIYENKQIAGGKYNQNGFKDGLWLEMAEYFCDSIKTIISKVYKNGIEQSQTQNLINLM